MTIETRELEVPSYIFFSLSLVLSMIQTECRVVPWIFMFLIYFNIGCFFPAIKWELLSFSPYHFPKWSGFHFCGSGFMILWNHSLILDRCTPTIYSSPCASCYLFLGNIELKVSAWPDLIRKSWDLRPSLGQG